MPQAALVPQKQEQAQTAIAHAIDEVSHQENLAMVQNRSRRIDPMHRLLGGAGAVFLMGMAVSLSLVRVTRQRVLRR
jgi:hypothetical protein